MIAWIKNMNICNIVYTCKRKRIRTIWLTLRMPTLFGLHCACPLYLAYIADAHSIWLTLRMPTLFGLHCACPLYLAYIAHAHSIWLTLRMPTLFGLHCACPLYFNLYTSSLYHYQALLYVCKSGVLTRECVCVFLCMYAHACLRA